MSVLTFFESFFNKIFAAVKPGLLYLEANVPAELVEIIEAGILAGFSGGWTAFLNTMEVEAISKGIQTTKTAIAIAANAAQSNLIATGAIAAPNATPATN